MAVVWFRGIGTHGDAVRAVVAADHLAVVDDGRSAAPLANGFDQTGVIIATSVTGLTSLDLRGVRWAAWDLAADPDFAAAARAAGAMAVLPSSTTPDELESAVQSLVPTSAENRTVRERHHRVRSVIPVPNDTTVEIVQGVIARVAIHPEGDEVLLGLHGVGELLSGHPNDGCYIELVATTDIAIRCWPWESIQMSSGVSGRLREQLIRSEAWAAVRARPTVELRLLGILGQLADRFGEPCEGGLLIPFRLTQPMLASAIGATRSTVSRTMVVLERQGYVSYAGVGAGRRVIVSQAAQSMAGHA